MNIFKKLKKKIKSVSGNSLAEFAVTTAMMATLATTAAPRFSGIGEGAKEKKTLAEIDKIIISASNFYNDKVVAEGRGRFPGQTKYNEPVGDYNNETELLTVIGPNASNPFNLYDMAEGSKWRSIFGTNANGASMETTTDLESSGDGLSKVQHDDFGATEFLHEFANNAIPSPYQDGHYIYIVLKGGQNQDGIACNECSPILYVADNENPAELYKKYQP